MRSFRGVFIAVVIGTAMIVSAFLVNSRRPRVELVKGNVALIRATGKCADCHRDETAAVVHEFEMSRHNAAGVNCLHCHQPVDGQEVLDHKDFQITRTVTSANCKQCHPEQYEQYLKSRHAAPAWAAVSGKDDFTDGTDPGVREISPWRCRPTGECAGAYGRPGGHDQGLPEVPRRGQTEPGRFDWLLHGLPRAARRLDRAGPYTRDLRPVPHGARTTLSSRSTTSRSTACFTTRRSRR